MALLSLQRQGIRDRTMKVITTNYGKWKKSINIKKAAFYIEKSRRNCHECLVEEFCKTVPFKKGQTCRQIITKWLNIEIEL